MPSKGWVPSAGGAGRPVHAAVPCFSLPAGAFPAVRLYAGDCLDVLAHLPSGSVDLAFADPPFNNGWTYDVYHDRLGPEEYLAWCARWLAQLKRVLRPTGALVVACPPAYQAEIKIILNNMYWWKETIIWHYTFGPHQKRKLTPSWVALHHCVVDASNYTWNGDAVRVPSARQAVYNDRRASPLGKHPDSLWHAGTFSALGDVWPQPRVAGTFKERTNHPCQMPVALLKRVVALYAPPGGRVLDPFAGSGTTLVAALELGREALGVELSRAYCNNIIVPRLRALTHPAAVP